MVVVHINVEGTPASVISVAITEDGVQFTVVMVTISGEGVACVYCTVSRLEPKAQTSTELTTSYHPPPPPSTPPPFI